MLVSVTVIETWVYGCELLTGQRGTFQAYLGEVLDKLCNINAFGSPLDTKHLGAW